VSGRKEERALRTIYETSMTVVRFEKEGVPVKG